MSLTWHDVEKFIPGTPYVEDVSDNIVEYVGWLTTSAARLVVDPPESLDGLEPNERVMLFRFTQNQGVTSIRPANQLFWWYTRRDADMGVRVTSLLERTDDEREIGGGS